MATKKKTNKKTTSRRSARPLAQPKHDEEVQADKVHDDGVHDEVLTQEELLERIRRARVARAGVEYQHRPPQPKEKGPVKPFIPPFDPNLPPAAFPSLPTLTEPIPTGTREGHLRRVKEDRERRLQGLEPLPRESYHPGSIFKLLCQSDATDINNRADHDSRGQNEVPSTNSPDDHDTMDRGQNEAPGSNCPVDYDTMDVDEPDAECEKPEGVKVNWKASNTPLNPVCKRNMATMACQGQVNPGDQGDSDLANRPDLDFSDSDVEIESGQEPSVPKWCHLTQSLRAEILDNLLEKNTWINAVNKLGLSLKQQKRAQESLTRFHKIMEREDIEIKKMHERQRRVILGVDRSHDQTLTEEQVLNRISREHQENIIKDPDQRLRRCKKGDLRKAWSFLDERGLPQELAGDWSNSTESIRLDDDDNDAGPTTKRIKWSRTLTISEGPSIASVNPGPASSSTLGEKSRFLGSFNQRGSVARTAQQQHPMQNMQQRCTDWNSLYTEPDENQAHLARGRRLQLAFGAGRAAEVMANQDRAALPEPAAAQFRYEQRIEQARVEAKAQRQAEAAAPREGKATPKPRGRPMAADRIPFTTRDITDGSYLDNMEARYEELARACELIAAEGAPQLDQEGLDRLLEETSQFNEVCEAILAARSSSEDRAVQDEAVQA